MRPPGSPSEQTGGLQGSLERLSPHFQCTERVPVLAPSDFAQSIAEAARTLYKPRRLDETLQTIVEVACNSVPGFDHAGISTVERTGKIETKACTNDLVARLDAMQYELREGPCSAVLHNTDVVSVSILDDEQRWLRYVPHALEAGVRSQMAVKLYLDVDTLGGINFYSTTSGEVTDDARALARLFATHAAIALGHAQERADLNQDLQTRRVIGQALGILMERYEMNEDRAFAFLVRASSHRNIKLRAIAQELVAEANAR
jgi:GAF domain-containing protein